MKRFKTLLDGIERVIDAEDAGEALRLARLEHRGDVASSSCEEVLVSTHGPAPSEGDANSGGSDEDQDDSDDHLTEDALEAKAIAELLAADPHATNKSIVEALAARDMKVTSKQVTAVKKSLNKPE